MIKMTHYDNNGWYISNNDSKLYINIDEYNNMHVYGEVIDKFADYEKSGLTPSQVMEVCNVFCNTDINIEDFLELVKAYKDSKCIILPCKVGDKYYTIARYCTEGGYFSEPTEHSITDCERCDVKCDMQYKVKENIFNNEKQILEFRHYIGANVYLSRREAEEELRKLQR